MRHGFHEFDRARGRLKAWRAAGRMVAIFTALALGGVVFAGVSDIGAMATLLGKMP